MAQRLLSITYFAINACLILLMPLTALALVLEVMRCAYHFSIDEAIQWATIKNTAAYTAIIWAIGIPWMLLRARSISDRVHTGMSKEEIEKEIFSEKLDHALEQIKILSGDVNRIDILEDELVIGDGLILIITQSTKTWLDQHGYWDFIKCEQDEETWVVKVDAPDLWRMIENLRLAGEIEIYNIDDVPEINQRLRSALTPVVNATSLALTIDESRMPVDYFTIEVSLQLALQLDNAGFSLPESYYPDDEEEEIEQLENDHIVLRHLDYQRFAGWADRILKSKTQR